MTTRIRRSAAADLEKTAGPLISLKARRPDFNGSFVGKCRQGLRVMRSRVVKASFILGFEGLQRAIDPVGCGIVDSYPHYSIERWPKTAHWPERLRIIFAVAGFAPDQFAITLVDNHLFVRGDQKNDGEARHYLHRGIAARRFQRVFRLADGLQVLQADLAYGLLSVDLIRRTTESLSKIIKIEARDGSSVA